MKMLSGRIKLIVLNYWLHPDAGIEFHGASFDPYAATFGCISRNPIIMVTLMRQDMVYYLLRS